HPTLTVAGGALWVAGYTTSQGMGIVERLNAATGRLAGNTISLGSGNYDVTTIASTGRDALVGVGRSRNAAPLTTFLQARSAAGPWDPAVALGPPAPPRPSGRPAVRNSFPADTPQTVRQILGHIALADAPRPRVRLTVDGHTWVLWGARTRGGGH